MKPRNTAIRVRTPRARRQTARAGSWAILLALSLKVHAADAPRLELHREPGGLRLEATGVTGVTGRTVLQQSDAAAGAAWGRAQVTEDWRLVTRGPHRVFRLLVIPEQPPAANAFQLESLAIAEGTTRLTSGEHATFEARTAANVPVRALWRVNGRPGGSAEDGVIDTAGRYTAPPTRSPRFVTIQAEAPALFGGPGWASMQLEIIPPPPADETLVVTPAAGGVVNSASRRARLEIPPAAVAQPLELRLAASPPEVLTELNDSDNATHDLLARVEVQPNTLSFPVDAPATLHLALNRVEDPGTRLELEFEVAGPQGITYLPAGLEGVVAADGVTWSVSFSSLAQPAGARARARAALPGLPPLVLVIRKPRIQLPPLQPAMAVVETLPATLEILEGDLRPFLIRGWGFSPNTRASVHHPGQLNLGASEYLQIVESAYNRPPTQGSPDEFAVLVKSRVDPTLGPGATRPLVVRLRDGSRQVSVPLVVRGLAEFTASGGTQRVNTVTFGTNPVFSRIEVGPQSTLVVRDPMMAWQATDEAVLLGRIDAAGEPGIHGSGSVGGGAGITPPPAGAGRGGSVSVSVIPLIYQDALPGVPTDQPFDPNIFLPSSEWTLFGHPGANGYDGQSSGDYESEIEPPGEEMHSYYRVALAAAQDSRTLWDYDFWRRFAEDQTGDHPSGRKGQQGRPGGFVLAPGFGGNFGVRRSIEPGGGGGGGGVTFRPVLAESELYGLGGGSGGGGGRAVSIVAGRRLELGADAIIDTTGGNGGNGGGPVGLQFTPGELRNFGRGGGGGPGGAGTARLLAGVELQRPATGSPFIHRAGAWGDGGFLMVGRSHQQANPHSWLEPATSYVQPIGGHNVVVTFDELVAGRSKVEASGPDFSPQSSPRGLPGIRTGILRCGGFIEAYALNSRSQPAEITVINGRDTNTIFLQGSTHATRRVRLSLRPGLNEIRLNADPAFGVLNRHILVLTTVDSDGDGLSDCEEAFLGTNPRNPTTHAGIGDRDFAVGGGTSTTEVGDSDGDGFPDVIETDFNSDPFDFNSTPMYLPDNFLGRGQTVSTPRSVEVLRPVFGSQYGVAPGVTVSRPADPTLLRPVFGAQHGVVPGITVSRPADPTVVRPVFGHDQGVAPGIVTGRPASPVIPENANP